MASSDVPSLKATPGLRNGDYAVHLSHGIGLFRGLETITTPTATPTGGIGENIDREYLVLEYRAGDKLYVPADQIDRVRPFVGTDSPELDKLGGQGWAKSYARARREADAVAAEMLDLYTARMVRNGYAYKPDTPKQKALEAAFPHSETPDQLAAIADVKRDMEAPRPMDRLLVGDVGYGKTEVAVRAAFKAVSAKRQVAVLCPTSVLAAQHFQTFSERLNSSGEGKTVALLSRFVLPEEQKTTLEGIRKGEFAVVVGTHRLLSDDVMWKDLGLVVVDEEQRFGVAHKEALKRLRETVDMLTMTATPIPRTLSLATLGLLDVSVIADPPQGRAPIETTIHRKTDSTVREAILREIGRGGQVFYLHNRVESIADTAAHLQEIVPEARFTVAHGQMSEDELEDAMQQFYEHTFDVLVCTTIIEIGLDIPNANTLIVEDADRFGLAQLYQLRGRVGRSDRQAYAVFLIDSEEGASGLTDEAAARLAALREFTAPGAGHQIAQRDLHLRGAGSLLGLEQSGTSAARCVGYDLFLQFLEQAVREQRGQKADPKTVPLPTIEIPFLDAAIPATYVSDPEERLALYNQAASVRSAGELSMFRDALTEHCGPLPPSIKTLIRLTHLRLRCRTAGVKAITAEAGGRHITLTFRRGAKLLSARIAALNPMLRPRGFTVEADRAVLNVAPSDALDALEEGVEVLAKSRRKQQK